MEREKVVLVDEQDNDIGEMEKLKAHKLGRLHRAFSVFIFNEEGEVLLQQRALSKYHGAGLWSNACCSHPQKNEEVKESAVNRLNYEMGLKCNIEFLFSSIYRADVENGLTEHEYDHVFTGKTNTEPSPNFSEVQDFTWKQPDEVLNHMVQDPGVYTVWFRKLFPEVLEKMQLRN